MRERLRDVRAEGGASLIELAVTLLILGVVMAVFLTLVESLQTASGRQEARVRRNDEAQHALAQLDREIRSGNVLYDPMLESDPTGDIVPGMSLRVYTQADAPNRSPGSQCAQWRITDGTMQTRRWDPAEVNPVATPWWTVATDIVNRTTTPAVPAFSIDSNMAYGKRIMKISIVVDRADDAAEPQQLDLSITGRNTQNGFPVDICEDPPAY